MNRTATPTAPDTFGVDSHSWLQALASHIADSGIAAHEADVARAERRLRCDGHHALLLDIVADTAQPAVARERAFGMLLVDASTPRARAMAAA